MATNLNEAGTDRVEGIALGNALGAGIVVASLPELGEGGSWSTCTNGCNQEPPRDVAHVQFRSRIAWKLVRCIRAHEAREDAQKCVILCSSAHPARARQVWCPPAFDTFVLVDDGGELLNTGTPAAGSRLPSRRAREMNFALVKGSKYATEAERVGA